MDDMVEDRNDGMAGGIFTSNDTTDIWERAEFIAWRKSLIMVGVHTGAALPGVFHLRLCNCMTGGIQVVWIPVRSVELARSPGHFLTNGTGASRLFEITD